MAIDFPASPNANQTFTVGSITYKWDGTKWIGLGVTPADRLVEGSNSLEITAGNDLVWTGDNVGIKTTDPQSALEVVDNISFTSGDTMPQLRIKATSGAIGKVMNLGLNETDDYGLIQTMDRGTGYSTALILQPYGSARVGIGEGFSDPSAKLEVRDSAAQGVIIRATNTQNTTANKALRIRNNSDVDTASISHRGTMMLGTNVPNSFNGVGQEHGLIVAGETSDTDITDNSKAAITISNTDGTADNTAGLHFAREDNDGNPHYCGASIVAQFKETQVTGQYPKADLAFLTSIAANNAPSEKMRIYANGAVTKPDNPLIQTVMSDVYGASQTLTLNPPSAISNGGASISRGTNGFSTTGTNAYTYVCPVDGIYAVFAHISLGNVTQPDGTRDAGDRTIWVMGYTLGGGNLPLANYVEIIDTNVFDYENASYYNVWNFTAGTRVGCGLNSGNGQASGLAMQWGVHLIQ